MNRRPLLANSAGRSILEIVFDFPVGWSDESGLLADFESSVLDIIRIRILNDSEVDDEITAQQLMLMDAFVHTLINKGEAGPASEERWLAAAFPQYLNGENAEYVSQAIPKLHQSMHDVDVFDACAAQCRSTNHDGKYYVRGREIAATAFTAILTYKVPTTKALLKTAVMNLVNWPVLGQLAIETFCVWMLATWPAETAKAEDNVLLKGLDVVGHSIQDAYSSVARYLCKTVAQGPQEYENQEVPTHAYEGLSQAAAAIFPVINPVAWALLTTYSWGQAEASTVDALRIKYAGTKVHYTTKFASPSDNLGMKEDGGFILDNLPCGGGQRIALTISIRNTKKRAYYKVLNKLYPPTHPTDARHMTSHLASLAFCFVNDAGKTTPSDVNVCWAGSIATPAARLRRLNEILRFIPIGTSQQLACAMVIAGLGHSEGQLICENYLMNGLLFTHCQAQQQRLKLLGTHVRKTAHDILGRKLNGGQVACMAYYDMLFGRAANVTNWDEEIANRCYSTVSIRHYSSLKHVSRQIKDEQTGMYSTEFQWVKDDRLMTNRNDAGCPQAYLKMLREQLDIIIKPLITKRNVSEPLAAFLQRRHEWMASGSSGGYHVDVPDKRTGKMKRVPGGKRAYGEFVTVGHIRSVIERQKPVEHAVASEKFENGKSRAIYGVGPDHYIINTYATKGFEERLYLIPGLEKGAGGLKVAVLEEQRALTTADGTVECMMLDYADFNRHHTPAAQAALFDAFADAGEAIGAQSDWVAANRWIAQSKYNMTCKFPNTPELKQVLQGMFSGTRSTDLINTLLNLAYFRVAQKLVEQQWGIKADDLYHVHQGDDVWISTKNKLWCRLLFYTLHQQGFIFQETKQMFGAKRGEYLRVLYSDGAGYGYTARALANYLLRPLQNDVTENPASWAATISDSCALLVRRGLGLMMAHVMYKEAVQYWVRARAHPRDLAPVSVPPILLQAPKALGGLGAGPPGAVWPLLELPPHIRMPQLSSTMSFEGLHLPTHMTDDWIAKVSARNAQTTHEKEIHVQRLRDAMVLENYGSVLSQVQRERGYSQYKKQMAKVARESKQLSQGFRMAAVPRMASNAAEVIDNFFDSFEIVGKRHPTYAAYDPKYIITAARAHPKFAPNKLDEHHESITQLVSRSIFKSEARTAQAYNVTRRQALEIIISSALDNPAKMPKAVWAILTAIETDRAWIIECLYDGGLHLMPTLAAFMNKDYIQQIDMGFAESLAITEVYLYPWTLPDVIRRHARAYKAWIDSTVRGRCVLAPVLY